MASAVHPEPVVIGDNTPNRRANLRCTSGLLGGHGDQVGQAVGFDGSKHHEPAFVVRQLGKLHATPAEPACQPHLRGNNAETIALVHRLVREILQIVCGGLDRSSRVGPNQDVSPKGEIDGPTETGQTIAENRPELSVFQSANVIDSSSISRSR